MIIEIPLFDSDEFELYQLHPLPMLEENKYVWTNIAHTKMIVDNAQKTFTFIEENEVCLVNNRLIYAGNRPTFNFDSTNLACEADTFVYKTSDDCKWTVSEPNAYWTPISDQNKWLFAIPTEMKVKINCDNSTVDASVKKIGLLTIDDDCSLSTANMIIRTKKNKQNKQNNEFTRLTKLGIHTNYPKVNNSVHILGKNKSKINTTELANAIHNLQAQQSVTHWQWNSHTTIIYILIFVIFIVLLIRK